MDETNQGENLHQRTIDVSLRRAQSLPNTHSLIQQSWSDELGCEFPSLQNHRIGTTNNLECLEGYKTGQQQNSDYITVGPFEESSLHSNVMQTPFDINMYQQKKTLAQGMMDLALISANANQMRYVLQLEDENFYSVAMCMIIMSLILQVVVGIGLIWNSRYNVKKETHARQANKTNNWTVIGIFLVTILNVFISSFGVSTPSTKPKYVDDILQEYDTFKHNSQMKT